MSQPLANKLLLSPELSPGLFLTLLKLRPHLQGSLSLTTGTMGLNGNGSGPVEVDDLPAHQERIYSLVSIIYHCQTYTCSNW